MEDDYGFSGCCIYFIGMRSGWAAIPFKKQKEGSIFGVSKKKAVSHKTPQTHLAGPGQGEGDSLPNRCCFFPSRRWTARFLGDKEIEGSCKDKSLKVSRKIQQTIHDDIGLHIGFFQILQPGFSC